MLSVIATPVTFCVAFAAPYEWPLMSANGLAPSPRRHQPRRLSAG